MIGAGPPRLAWVLYGSLRQKTGGTIYDERIVAGLRERGTEVDVVSLAARRQGASAAAALVRALARTRPDVVVGDELCFRELAFVFPRVPFTRRVLLVHHLTCWEAEGERRARARGRARRAEATVLRHADRIVTTSHATRGRLVHEGVQRPIDAVVPGADRLELVRAHPGTRAGTSAEDVVTFLFIGALTRRKRVLELVRGHARVRASRRVVLRLAGSPAHDPRYAAGVAREIASPDDVVLLGEIGDAALAREIASADAVILPSSLEGYGIAATEAGRAGKPIFATRTAGLVEALAPAGAAVCFLDDVSPAGLAAAMSRFANDDALRSAMTASARVGLARWPTWAEAAGHFAALIDEDRRRPRA